MARKKSGGRKKKADLQRKFLLLTKDEARRWTVELRGNELTTYWGECDGKLRSSSKEHNSVEAAQKDVEKRVKEKMSKGYVEMLPHDPDPTQLALEDALAADPDDDGAHAAYADYLQEQGNPKGEYLQLQLALEDDSLDDKQRRKFRQRSTRLFNQHRITWFGELMLLLRRESWFNPEYRRGWLDRLGISELNREEAGLLAQSPQLRLLRELVIQDVSVEPTGKRNEYGHPALEVLYDCPCLSNVQMLRVGDDVYCEVGLKEEHVIRLMQTMPRLENLILFSAEPMEFRELYTATFPSRLKGLTIGGDTEPVAHRLVQNPTLASLTSLELKSEVLFREESAPAPLEIEDLEAICHSGRLKHLKHLAFWRSDVGDVGIEVLITSGMLDQLESLDLSYGCVTDEGALRLAEAINPEQLKELCLDFNAIDEPGGQALQEKLPDTELAGQHDPDDRSYLLGEYYDMFAFEEFDDDWE